MHVALRCPCGASLKAPVKYVGRELKCPKCSQMLVVPEPPVAAASQPAELEVLEPFEMPGTEDVLPATSPLAAPAMAAPAAAPTGAKKAARKKKKNTLLPYLIGVGVLAIAGAGIYLYMEYKSNFKEMDKVVVKGTDGKQMSKADLDKMAHVAPPKAAPPIANKFDTKAKKIPAKSGNVPTEDLTYKELINVVEPSMVRILVTSFTGEKSIGSGFFIDTEGKIVTNNHVIEGASEVTIETADGKKTKAIGYLVANNRRDLAIVQIDPDELECMPIAIARTLPEKGDNVVAFGSPQGFGFTNTQGRIGSIRTNKEVQEIMGQGSSRRGQFAEDMRWIQHSAAISGGNSGGPLVNFRGELIGVNTWTHSQGQNLNFASTMEQVHTVFDERKKGEIFNFSPRRGR